MTRIRFNAFDMACVAHQSPGLWRSPDDRAWRYTELDYWTNLAQLLEHGLFDGLFLADVLGPYDRYGDDATAALRQAAQLPVNDPMMAVSAMAAVTTHLGFGVTAGTSFEHPYPFARRASTLDHLTNGRFGWNIVTGYLPSAAHNTGQTPRAHDERYEHADEYLEVVYKLWEGSWDTDAVVRDAERGVFTNPDKVHPIAHHGTYFTVPGIHLSEPSPQRTPVLYQAGASPRGQQFAAEHAEAIFTGAPTKAILAEEVAGIRHALRAAGRDPYSAKIYTMLTVITDATAQAAHAKHDALQTYASPEGALVFMSGWMGVDLSAYDLDDPIGDIQSDAIQSVVASFQQAAPSGRAWTVRDLAAWGGIGGHGPRVVGSPAEVADELQSWVADTDIDGFNLPYATTPGTFADIVHYLVPELQRRGVYPTEYPHGTLRQKLFGLGDHLPAEHRGASHRIS